MRISTTYGTGRVLAWIESLDRVVVKLETGRVVFLPLAETMRQLLSRGLGI